MNEEQWFTNTITSNFVYCGPSSKNISTTVFDTIISYADITISCFIFILLMCIGKSIDLQTYCITDVGRIKLNQVFSINIKIQQFNFQKTNNYKDPMMKIPESPIEIMSSSVVENHAGDLEEQYIEDPNEGIATFNLLKFQSKWSCIYQK